MPHAVMLVVRANEILGDPSALDEIGRKLAGTTTLLDAVEALDLLGAVEEPHRDTVRRAVGAVPDAVGRALVASVASAVARNVPVVVQWKPGPFVELQVWEAVDDGAGHVGVTLVSPRASDLAAGSTA